MEVVTRQRERSPTDRRADAEAAFARLGGAAPDLPGAAHPWLADLRRAGRDRFLALGLPTTRLEAWKFTNLRALTRLAFTAAGESRGAASVDLVPSLLPPGSESFRAVFVNGRFRADLSRLEGLPPGAKLMSLATVLAGSGGRLDGRLGRIVDRADQPLVALHDALMDDGVVLQVAKGVDVKAPIELVFIGGLGETALGYHPRHFLRLDANASASVVEHHVDLGDGSSFANSVTEIDVGAGARLSHCKVQATGETAFHLSTLHARVGKDGAYDSYDLCLGARLSRNEMSVVLAGEGASTTVAGAYLLRGEQHCDNTTAIEHRVAHTTSNEVFKGVLDGRARAVFQGKIKVAPHAQKSDGRQINKTILLSDDAEIDTKPELEIYADDVKCSHGAAAGEIDADQLFYLRSRGLPASQARRLLIRAFLDETLDIVRNEGLRQSLADRIDGWLGRSGGGC